jgi:hypothetical protein
MKGNHLWNDGMTKGNTICPRPFHGGGIKIDITRKHSDLLYILRYKYLGE